MSTERRLLDTTHRLNREPAVRLHALQHDVLRLVPQLQRVLHRHVSVTIASPVARGSVPALGAFARAVVLASSVVPVALLALDVAFPAGVGVARRDAVNELVDDPDHVVVRVPYRLERTRARVETTAGHGVDQSLSFVDVVCEPEKNKVRMGKQ